MKKIKVWVYIRVSTEEQAKNGHGKDLQLTKIKAYIDYNFDKGFEYNEDLVYKDLWISGAKDDLDRPWLAKLKDDIKKWKIDVVIVYKLDRLWRKTKIILELIEFFNIYNISFISTTENIDTSSHTWKFFLTVLWAIAEMERDLFAEKTREWALEAVKKWFFSSGWSPCLWFIKNDKTRNLEIVEEEANIIKDIFDLYVNENKSLAEIARLLTSKKILPKHDRQLRKRKNENNYWVWNPTNISQILSNEAYIGLYWLNKSKDNEYIWEDDFWNDKKFSKRWERDKNEWIPLEVENIVDNEIYEKAQKMLVQNKFRNNNNNKPIINHLFSQVLKCWECGSRYKGDKGKIDKDWDFRHYYRCWKTNPSKYWDNKCDNSQIRESELKDNIFKEINKYFQKPELILETYLNKSKEHKNIERYKSEFENNETSIKKTYTKICNLVDKSLDEEDKSMREIYNNMIEENKSNINILKNRNEELREIIQNHERNINDKIQFEKYIEKYKWQDIYKLTKEEQKEFIENCIKDIRILKDEVVVTLFFRTESEDLDTKKDENFQNENIRPALFQMVGQAGLEPTTLALKGPCSTNWATIPFFCFHILYKKN